MEMAKVFIKCEVCDLEFERKRGEVNRSKRLGRPQYCSRRCSAKANEGSLGEHLGSGRPENLIKGNRRDKYSEFKWFMRCIRRRNKEYNVDLEFLKNLWEEQSGICPLTGWSLMLPKHSSKWKTKQEKQYRASIDRIDNSKGYTKGNIRFISVMANYCKNDFTDEEVKLFCEAVVKNASTSSPPRHH